VLEENRSPSRKAGELDNRGSHFYLALYWARELAEQDEDAELAARFGPLAERLSDQEEQIVRELRDVQGSPVDIDGYYRPDPERMAEAMRPSATLNDALGALYSSKS
jgi:isocitrate dehydrogenase